MKILQPMTKDIYLKKLREAKKIGKKKIATDIEAGQTILQLCTYVERLLNLLED